MNPNREFIWQTIIGWAMIIGGALVVIALGSSTWRTIQWLMS
jgi:hypothetical protein